MDPEASYNRQRSRAGVLIAGHGEAVETYFDIGLSRSLPWKRREKACSLDETVRAMVASRDAPATPATDNANADMQRRMAECDTILKKYRAALGAGTDPESVGEWITEIKAERTAIIPEDMTQTTDGKNVHRLDETDIKVMIKALGDVRLVIQGAEPADKAIVYRELGLRLTYEPGKHFVRAQMILGPDISGL